MNTPIYSGSSTHNTDEFTVQQKQFIHTGQPENFKHSNASVIQAVKA